MNMKLSVIGLGKLGACSAACFAAKGFEVIGVDISKKTVDAINQSKAPVFEPQLQETILKAKGRLTATQEYEFALLNSDVSFFIVPTPSKKNGHFSDEYLKDSLEKLATALKRKKTPHVFVITSTVSPGTTEKVLIPLVESISRKKLNKGFYFCYNPEFIALGSVIKDFLNPDVVLIGESDKKAGDILESIYHKTCDNTPDIARMSIVSAEITKISLNSYITMKISFANTIANICNEIPGADVDSVTRALGADKRISPYYIKGGLSYGGPCFPRDNRAFAAFAGDYGVNAYLAKATDVTNKKHIDRLTDLIIENLPQNSSVGILGIAYKPDTSVIEESASILLIKKLLKKKANIIAYDPLAIDNTKNIFKDRIQYASSVVDCIAASSICVIMGQHKEFKPIDNDLIGNRKITIIDCWRLLRDKDLGNKTRYIPYGMNK
jgi:UDPglucose 6-dehydrogenase